MGNNFRVKQIPKHAGQGIINRKKMEQICMKNYRYIPKKTNRDIATVLR